jgi:PIN domain nuclease of toxin-antitoxin system
MKLLIDTHTFLWFIESDPNLSGNALVYLKDGSNEIYLSVASVWEITIKVGNSKLRIAEPLGSFIHEQLDLNRINAMSIRAEHAASVSGLPLHHRDPFDRLIVAQSIVEQMPIISKDAAFDAYGVTRLW